MLIPEEKVQEILERTDIVGLVGTRVELRRAGRSLKGLCPFHGERTPSFHVNPDRRRFKCFGCGASGDSIAFVMKHEGKSFVEAARELAALAGVRLDDAGDDALHRQRLAQRRVHQLAAAFYRDRLWDRDKGLRARQYLKKRGLTRATLERFQLGVAPDAWGEFSAAAAAAGMLELALNAGLVSPRKELAAPRRQLATVNPPGSGAPAVGETGEKRPAKAAATYDFFRGRLMIPIRNPEGATVAFGARILSGDDPRKFINSRESQVYKKAELLFAIDQASATIRQTGQALLVEGYFDALALHQAGLTNAVALCSASLTAEQVKLLRRFEAKELVLILDGDDAGRRGVQKAAGALLATAMPTRVVVLPQGVDPDDHVLAVGGEAFKALVAGALPLTEHLVGGALPRGAGASFEERLKGIEALKPILAQVPEGLERTLFLKTVSERLGVAESALATHLNDTRPRAASLPRGAAGSSAAQPASATPPKLAVQASPLKSPSRKGAGGLDDARRRPALAKLLPEEALLLAHLLREPELARLPQSAELESLTHLGLRAAAAAVVDGVIDGRQLNPPELLAALDPGIRRQIQEFQARVAGQSAESHRQEFLQRCTLHRGRLAQAELEELQLRLREVGSQIAELKKLATGDPAQAQQLRELEEEHLRLILEKQAVSRARRPAALH